MTDPDQQQDRVRVERALRARIEQFENEAKWAERAGAVYEASSGGPDLTNHGAAAAWRLAASRLRDTLTALSPTDEQTGGSDE